MSLVLYAIFFGFLSQTVVGTSCPIECVCQGFSADCSNRNLVHVPRSLPANILKIDLQGNKIRVIKYEDLSYLKSLRILLLNNNQIETIERGSLDTMTNLERLSLNNNELSYFPHDLFSNLKNLKSLDLSFNKIKLISKELLSGLHALNNLQLDSNQVKCIEKGAFNNLINLNILTLNNNKLKLLHDHLFTNLNNLNNLAINNNLLECGCKILWFREWLKKHANLANEVKCFSAKQKKFILLNNLNELGFECSLKENDDIDGHCEPETECPIPCVCENNIVDCKDRSLTEIPKNLPKSTIELHLKRNFISNIPSEVFKGLKNLRLLDLSYNRIQNISAESLKDLESLNTLILFRNEINYMPPLLFHSLPKLQFLLLNANKISCLHKNTFTGLAQLNLLSLFDNQLKTLPEGLFEPLKSVQTIHLGRNPLICDCRLKWLNEYFHTHPVEKSGIACNMPRRMAKKSIGLIPNSRFRCSVKQNFDRTCDQFDKCPVNCNCQGSIVDCRSLGLDHLPEDIPASTTELHLQDNNLRVIKSNGAFKKLKNLQRLDLRNNKIYLIEENAFQGADQLSELFLNDNFLSNISPNMFRGLQNLKTLLLRSNRLHFLTNSSFENLEQLRLLSLYDNQISCIQRGAFENLKSLSTLNLMSNPFVCNCGLKWLKDWLKHANIATGNPKCSAPAHLKDHSLVNLDDRSFECHLNHAQFDECGNILVPLTAINKASSCPLNCSCSDKKVRCSHLKLAMVPQDIPLDVKELYLDSNEIEEIPEFLNKFLYLEKLDLSSNRIKEIPSRVFERLTQLDTLILSFNSIECVGAESFAGLFKLRLLSLYANKLTLIPDGAFKDLKSLSHIALGLNPLFCDCNLAWLSTWIKSDYVEPGIARCTGPALLSNKLVLTTPTHMFTCSHEHKAPINCLNSCYQNSCQNNATCVPDLVTKGYKCQCTSGFYGQKCEKLIDSCYGEPCMNNGKCSAMGKKYKCECTVGWEGANCEINTNDCRSSPCLNNATCIDKLADYQCDCPTPYTGKNCQTKQDWCSSAQSNPCLNKGICIRSADSYRCKCPVGFDGQHCQTKFNWCLNHQCKNGICLNNSNNYTCKCHPGYTSRHCDQPKPIALPLQSSHKDQLIGCTFNDCLNGGICFRTTTNGRIDPRTWCKCKPGYIGQKCEILKSVKFDYEDSYVELDSQDTENTLNITLSFVTLNQHCILLYHGSKAKKHVSLELSDGRLTVSFDLGDSQTNTLMSYSQLNDAKEHTIQLVLSGRNLSLTIVDKNENKFMSDSGGPSPYLNVGYEPVYVGGVPNSVQKRIVQLGHVKNTSSLSGCITSLYVNSELKNIALVEYAHKVKPGCGFKEACFENPCQNGAQCRPIFGLNSDFRCECGHEFGGRFCERRKMNSVKYRAAPLFGRKGPRKNVKKETGCSVKVFFDYYADSATGCRTKRRIRMLRCEGKCARSELRQFKSISTFGYVIGTNNRQGVRSASECCVPVKTRNRRVKLFCEDGSTYLKTIELVRRCSCSNKCESSYV